jgi:DNA-directed RNA polymerase specialized sigma24 family protein
VANTTLEHQAIDIRQAFDVHGSTIFTLCRRFLDEKDASALTRDIFVAVAAQGEADQAPALLDETARRLALHADPSAVADAVERVRIADGLRKLTEPRRRLVTLALVDRLDHAEIAARTSIPAREVAAEIRAGLSAIRNHMTAMAPV